MRTRGPTFFTIALIAVAVIAIVATAGSVLYTDLLWFRNLGLSSVFTLEIWARILVIVASGVLIAGFIWLNLSRALAGRVGALPGIIELPIGPMIAPRRIRRSLSWISLAIGLFSGISISSQWLAILKYLRGVSFGAIEPTFGYDVSHYLFTLPVMTLVYQVLAALVMFTGIGVVLLYILTADVSFDSRRLRLSARARSHISLLVAGFIAVKALGYRVMLFNLNYSPRGQVFGASYTDVNAQAVALRLLIYISLGLAILLAANLRFRRTNIIASGIALMLAVSFILGTLYPTFVQQFTVEPDELNKEVAYIQHNIDLTRTAWGLADIEEVDYALSDDLTLASLLADTGTSSNIRLWDYRPLRSTYSQLQEIRLYYAFNDVDIDRYDFGGDYRQVAIAVRELDTDRLVEKTWINQHLVYTHGYGVVVSPVNRATPEGLPDFWIKDVPPVVSGPPATSNFALDQVRSYYGEVTQSYAIVNTEQSEFDYPLGDGTSNNQYDGRGGVQLSSPFVRLAFSLRMRSYQIFLANVINSDSRIMFYRNIVERAQRIAPFLRYDSDPYAVVSDGSLYWVIDAYTYSSAYPYSEPLPSLRINYARNSVKVVIDAYHGDTTFYLFDDEDPLALTYAAIFPDLFTPLEEMPAGIRSHMRYPQDLFEWQSQMYLTYHMRDPVAFYNKEDVWTIPNETYQSRTQPVEPYYLIMRLPGAEDVQFALLTPFTPSGKNNMIGWLAARSDGDNYGLRTLFRFPKTQLVYGPAQIESRIDQDTEISRDLTLWGQRGSEVIRGNLLVIPVDGSILYVEPIYLQAEATRLPEMKRVVVAFRDKIVMRETLDLALRAVFGQDGSSQPPSGTETVAELIRRASDLFASAEEAARNGNWAEYGRLQTELSQVLGELQRRSGETD